MEKHKGNSTPQPELCPRRPGTDDSGRKYEVVITALFSLRCATMKDTEDMWVGSNVDEVGDFDDIVLSKQTTEGKHLIYLVQLKHQDNPKNIARRDFTYSAENKQKTNKSKGDFSLFKYSTSFKDLKSKLDNPVEGEAEITKYMRKAHRILFVLYSNKGVDKCEFLKCLPDVNSSTLDFLNTSNAKKEYCYMFDETKLEHDSSFLQQLLLFCNQVHITGAENLIKTEIKRILGTSKLVDFENVTKHFVAFIKTWAKGALVDEKKNVRICYTLKKCDIINVLVGTFLKTYKINFSKEHFSDYDCPRKNLWNEAIRGVAVTIVDFNEEVFEFLKQYIGGEVARYCKESKQTWMDHLSKTAQDLFYEEHQELNNQVLRIIGSQKKTTLFDLYQNLWFNNKIPLLLELTDAQDYNTILKILKISNYNLSVIILNKTGSILPTPKSVPSKFVTLRDLNLENRGKLLDQLVKVQGRASTFLSNIIDETMYDYLNCQDIIKILLGNFSIGNEHKVLSEDFVVRKLFRIFLKFEVLLNTKLNEVFEIVDKSSDSNLLEETLKKLDLSEEDRNKIIIHEENSILGEEVLHRLVFHNENLLEWKESLGTTKNIREYQFIDQHRLYESGTPQDINCFWYSLDEVLESETKIHLLSASPGMGKSTLMDFIALEAPPNLWVLKINLYEHNDYYKSLKFKSETPTEHLDHLEYFNETILGNSEDVTLAKAVFKKLALKQNVLVLLDGFDEVSLLYHEEVVKIAKSLREAGFPVWLTTRPHMKEHLENELSALSSTLKPFTEQDQRNFLLAYFARINKTPASEENLIEEFVEKLLAAAKNNLNDRDCQFTGIPLQTKLLADVFNDDLAVTLKTGVVRFEDKFNLPDLYEKLVEKKIDVLCKKFAETEDDAKKMRPLFEEMRVFYVEHQQLFALSILFAEEDCKELSIDKKLDEYKNQKDKIHFLQREGVVVIEQRKKIKVNFVHRTFAEFFAAQWLSKNFKSGDDKIKITVVNLIKKRYGLFYGLINGFLYRMFDCILASTRGCQLHLAVILEQTKKAQEEIKTNPNCLEKLDGGGRSVLHVMAIYGLNVWFYYSDFALPTQFRTKKSIDIHDPMVDILKQIPAHKITDLKDEVLQYTPLDYAVSNRSFAYADKFCVKLQSEPQFLTLHYPNMNIDSLKDNLNCCLALGYKTLFKAILPQLIYIELLLNKVSKNESIKSYSEGRNTHGIDNLDNYLEGLAGTTISDLFKTNNKEEPCSESYYYRDLYLASALGTQSNVSFLLQENDVNGEDVYENTPLHCAVMHGCLEIVQLLQSKGALVDKPGKNGNAALHYASKKGFNEIASFLLSKNADVNRKNQNCYTPLLIALKYQNISTAKVLLSKGADHNTKDLDGNSALHYAVATDDLDVVLDLLNKGADINAKNEKAKTPLLVALKKCKMDVAKLLLSKGADFNTKDLNGNTVLHYAVVTDDADVVVDLLNRGACVNTTNNSTEVPLFTALKFCKVNTAKVLLLKSANALLKDNHGNSSIHYAAKYGCHEMITELLGKITGDVLTPCVSINVTNKNNQTPLHVAVTLSRFSRNTKKVERQIRTVQVLLDNGAEVNAQDHLGDTVFHYASRQLLQARFTRALFLKTFYKNITQRFLCEGADLSIQNESGNTAFDLVKNKTRNADILSLFKFQGDFAERRRVSARRFPIKHRRIIQKRKNVDD